MFLELLFCVQLLINAIAVWVILDANRARLFVFTHWNARELGVGVKNVGGSPARVVQLLHSGTPVEWLMPDVHTQSFLGKIQRVRYAQNMLVAPGETIWLFHTMNVNFTNQNEWRQAFLCIRDWFEDTSVELTYNPTLAFSCCKDTAYCRIPIRPDLSATNVD